MVGDYELSVFDLPADRAGPAVIGGTIRTAPPPGANRAVKCRHSTTPRPQPSALSTSSSSSSLGDHPIKEDEIAARQLHALQGYLRPRDRKLKLSDKELFKHAQLAETKRLPIDTISGPLAHIVVVNT
jgi:hypothetical protein